MYCNECGEWLELEDDFCPECGADPDDAGGSDWDENDGLIYGNEEDHY
jgi:RNA polymerase subunit RPABC4/transcription elongation factor Spt4